MFHLERMTTAHLDAVMVIEQATHAHPWTRTGYEYELLNNQMTHYFVLAKEASIIGYVGYWLQADEIHISIVAVHPDHQGQRFGKLLLLHALRDSYQHRPLLATLEVRQHNHIAQQLYRSLQFVHVGTRKRYYKDTGEDGLIMTVEPFDDRYFAQLNRWWIEQKWCIKGETVAHG